MTRGVRWYLVSSLVLAALIAVAGCSHYMLAEREPWRAEAELSCLNSGAVTDSPTRVRISAIDGAGACGITYPLRVSSLGGSPALGYDDESPRPPGAIPNGAMPQTWPGQNSGYGQQGYGQAGSAPSTPVARPSAIQSNALPPPPQNGPPYNPYQQQPYQQSPYPQTAAPRSYPTQAYPQQSYPPSSYPARQPSPSPPYSSASAPPQSTAQIGQPLSLRPPGVQDEPDDDEDIGIPGGPPNTYYGGPAPAPTSPRHAPPPLGPPDPALPRQIPPVAVQPAATLACPIVSALDQWINTSVQPAAMRWFRQPVVEIKQISAYSCRGMNGNPNAHISEHAFGNALDVAEFDLADGHKISVQYGWHGSPEEQGFLHDVQSSACDQFTTVLAPGANVYHYNHIHVDLMRHNGGRHICEPTAIPGEVAAARVRSRYAVQHDPNVTGSIPEKEKRHNSRPLGYSSEDDDSLPLAVPGND
jgi:hypothetical protein